MMRATTRFRGLVLLAALAAPAVITASSLPRAEAQRKRPAPSARPSASAEPPRDERREQARQLFAQAEEKLAAADFAGALDGYRAANALIRSPQAFFRIALCLDKLGLQAEALEAYRRFLALPPPASMSAEIRISGARIADADKGTLRITTKQPGVMVEVDEGSPVPVPTDFRLSPGPHRVRATAPGYEVGVQTYDVKTGETFELVVALAPVPPPATSAPAPSTSAPAARPEPARPTRQVAYGTWGVGLVAAGVGAYYGVRALKAKRDFDRAPTAELADRQQESAAIADVSLGLAVLLAITGGVFYAHASDAEAAVRVVPVVGTKSQGAAVSFGF
jgi:tetratricopeptide (TPR) repeat protein